MASLLVPTLPVSQAGRTLHDLGLAGMLGGNLIGRHALHPSVTEISDPAERGLMRSKDALVGAVAVAGLATAVEGVRFSRMEPGGAIPLRDGAHADARATPAEGRTKQRLDRLGAIALVAEVGLVAVNAALTQRNFRRPALRRLVMLRD